MADIEDLGAFVDSALHDDPDRQLEGVTGLRKLLSIERNPPIDAIIGTGIIPRLNEFLSFFNQPKLQVRVWSAQTP